jgi:Mn-dependent DtxR family transcriptional regulator
VEALQQLTRRQVEALQTIRRFEKDDRGVSLNAIAAALNVRAPSALGHLTPLEGRGLIVRHRGKSRLTNRGRGTLVEYERHHRIVEGLFSRLGLSPDDVCDAAREVDLAISHQMVERLCRAEHHPSQCPHGDPIGPCASERREN